MQPFYNVRRVFMQRYGFVQRVYTSVLLIGDSTFLHDVVCLGVFFPPAVCASVWEPSTSPWAGRHPRPRVGIRIPWCTLVSTRQSDVPVDPSVPHCPRFNKRWTVTGRMPASVRRKVSGP